MTARGSGVLIHRGSVVLVRGMQAGQKLSQYGFPHCYSKAGRGWLVPEQFLPDLAAFASMAFTSYRLEHDDGGDCECSVSLRATGRRTDIDPSLATEVHP